MPDQYWQSDFTHWQLAGGTGVEILNWLDDHSRYLRACVGFVRVGGDDVVNTFLTCGDAYGVPASTLTDNGAVYTSRVSGIRERSLFRILWCDLKHAVYPSDPD